MKILLVHNYYPVIGGGEDSVVEEERAMLEEAGHTVVPFFMYTKERGLRDFIFSAICLLWNPSAYRNVRKILQKEQPGVVHCHNTFPLVSPSVYWACRKEKIPVVQTLHNYRLICANGLFLRNGSVCEDCSGKSFAWPAIRHRCYRESFFGSILMVMLQWIHRMSGTWKNKVDRYIALTAFAKSRFVESGVLPEEHVCVKPNFISDPEFETTIAEKKRQFVFIGRLWPEKGCALLVEAWEKAYRKTEGLNGYELLVIGDGPERQQCEVLCGGDPENVGIHFAGVLPRPNVLEALRTSRLLILPSIWYEGFPMTIVEAFACGVPVVSAQLGSMLSIIEEQKTGLFFEAGNIDRLCDQIIWTTSHEEEMHVMGCHARAVYEAKYTREINCGQLTGIYEQI